MKNNKIKVIGSILGVFMFLLSYKMGFKGILNNDSPDLPNNDFSTSTSSPETPTVPSTIANPNSQTEPSIVETFNQEVIESKPTEVKTTEQEIARVKYDTNMYSSNTKESLKIANLQINDLAFKILSYDNNWDLVKCNNQIGYICRDDLEYSEGNFEEEYLYTPKNDIVITTTDLFFRTSPTTDAEIIKTFPPKTELEVIAAVSNGWLLVKSNGVIGYVHSDYTISFLDKAQIQYPELNLTDLKPEKIVYATTGLNIRAYYGTDYEIVGNLEMYESVRVLGEYGDWYFIMTNDYHFGFVNKGYTEELNDIYVIVDISKQRLYMYYNNELCLLAPVTTGKASTPSDIGLFEIWYKGTNEQITPTAFVHFWMPYNYSYEGLHDAELWRDEYGVTIEDNKANNYTTNGSNGCINMTYQDAKTVYENVSIGTKVLVHK